MNNITARFHIFMAAALLFVFILSGNLYAEEIKFELSTNRNTVYIGQSIQLSIQFQDTRDIPALDLPDIDGFNTRYVGPSSRMSFTNGRMSSSITHVYTLVPLKTGTFKVGPFSFTHEGNNYTSNQITIEIADSSQGRTAAPRSQTNRQEQLKDRIFLTMETGKSRIYLNETIPVTIKLYVSGISVRDIQYPEFNHEGFSVEQPGKPNQYQVRKGGTLYDVVEFRTSLFGIKAGEFPLGPATLEANLIMKRGSGRHSSTYDDFFGRDPFDDFFGRQKTEPIKVKSEPITLRVLPLPQDGRPAGFSGAVGDFDFNVQISPGQIKAGDPLTMKMTVTGNGNFNTVVAPGLKDPDLFKTYEPQGKQEENKKVFEQVLIPLDDSVKEVPEVAFSFFNTTDNRYRTISKGPFPITVTKPENAEKITIIEAAHLSGTPLKKEEFGRDIIYIKESPGNLKQKNGYLYKNVFFLLLNTLPLLLFFTTWTILKQKKKISSDIGYARRLAAPKKAKKGIRNSEKYIQNNSPPEFYDSVFSTVREYISNRFHIPPGGITSDIADDALKSSNINKETRSKVKHIFNECDMARYAPSEVSESNMEKTLDQLKEVIDYMERHK